MGHKHSKDDILQGALDAVFDDGLSQLTFGRLAKRLGISDRIIVDYFPTKDDLIAQVMGAVGLQLQLTLADAFTAPAADQCVARDQTAAVVADDRDLVEFEQVDHAANAEDVLVDGQRRVAVEPARATARKVDHMAGDVVHEVREQRAERRSADRPTVDEQHVGPAAHLAMGDLTRAHVEKAVGRSAELR